MPSYLAVLVRFEPMIFTHEFLNNRSAAPLLAELHRACFKPSWDKNAFSDLLSLNGTIAQITLSEAIPVAFTLYQVADVEAEILTLGVVSPIRKRNAAKTMLLKGILHLTNLGVKRIFLEVSETNIAAQNLYATAGFTEIGKRKKYYKEAEGSKDALVLEYQT